MNAATFRFDPVEHAYWLGDLRLPSVTQVLHDQLMLPDYSRLDPFYRERGSAVHAAVALDLLGKLDDDSLDPEHVLPYVQRFRRWSESAGFQPIFVEQPLYCPAYLYAGTPDALGYINTGELLLPDWKSGGYEPGHAVQVAGGYHPLLERLAEEGGLPVTAKEVRRARVGVLPLTKDLPQLVPVEDPAPLRDQFRSALACRNWRARFMGDVNGTSDRY